MSGGAWRKRKRLLGQGITDLGRQVWGPRDRCASVVPDDENGVRDVGEDAARTAEEGHSKVELIVLCATFGVGDGRFILVVSECCYGEAGKIREGQSIDEERECEVSM